MAIRGHLVNFGQSSGHIEPFRISMLFEKSNSVTRLSVFHYFTGPDRDVMAQALFSALADRVLTADRHHEYAFEDAAKAHADMEARKTAGAVVLIP